MLFRIVFPNCLLVQGTASLSARLLIKQWKKCTGVWHSPPTPTPHQSTCFLHSSHKTFLSSVCPPLSRSLSLWHAQGDTLHGHHSHNSPNWITRRSTNKHKQHVCKSSIFSVLGPLKRHAWAISVLFPRSWYKSQHIPFHGQAKL